MPKINFLIILVAAIIPMLLGMLWYSNTLFGKAWMKAAEVTEEKLRAGNMLVTFGSAFLFSILAAFILQFMVIHQFSVASILANEPGISDPNSTISVYLKDFMDAYGTNFRTFKHGALHGFLAGLFFAMPVIGMSSLFEQRGFKYLFIHAGFWIVALSLMGGVICQFS
jgi:hypothetical protein